MRNLKFTDDAWNSFLYWQTQDKKHPSGSMR